MSHSHVLEGVALVALLGASAAPAAGWVGGAASAALRATVEQRPLACLVGEPPAAPPAVDATAEAAAAFVAKDWPAAVKAYAALAATTPESAQVQYRLGVARLYTGDLAPGMAALDRAETLGWPLPQVAYRKATGHAAAGELEQAAVELRRAIAVGFGQLPLAEQDPLLASLRADARWPALRDAIDAVKYPCKHDPRSRAFDFWLGTWDVTPNGAPPNTPPAENVVTLEYGDCVVHEHWKSPGSNGESFNVFDASRGEWYQTWVDDGGGLHQYHGNPDAEGTMRFFTDLQYAPGQERRPTRLTFFHQGPDQVRQLSEQSADGGKTWTVNYDLIYRRRPGTSAR